MPSLFEVGARMPGIWRSGFSWGSENWLDFGSETLVLRRGEDKPKYDQTVDLLAFAELLLLDMGGQ